MASIGSRDKSVGWYDPPITSVVPPVRELLEAYAKFTPEEVVPQMLEARDRIWEVFPWPCVGQFRFMDLSLSRRPTYPHILQSVKDGARFLDVGCCFSQDLRKLVLDGAPPSNLWGLELQEEFIELSYDFFRDRDHPPAHFIHADLLDPSNAEVASLQGTVDIAQLGMILHVWDIDGQTEACERVVRLMKPVPGSLIIGQAVGHLDGVVAPGRGTATIFKHSAETFARLWEEVSRRTQTKWDCRAKLEEESAVGDKTRHWDDPRRRRLVFEIERLE